jgi:hypothetical protein
MKKIIFFLFISISCFSQNNKLSEYKTKAGLIIYVNDSIAIAYPRLGNEFSFITQGNRSTGTIIANTKVKITKIKKINGKYFLEFKGYGLLPVYIEYESALETGEIR